MLDYLIILTCSRPSNDCLGHRVIPEQDALLSRGGVLALLPMLHDVRECHALVLFHCFQHEVLRVEINESRQQHLGTVGSELKYE